MENYTITKEQILETIRTGSDVTKRYFKEIIPEAFKTKLDTGKWYKYKLALFYITNKISNNTNYYNVFGFDVDGNWMTDNATTYFDENYIEATPEEVEESLINEAKKRGYKEGVTITWKNKPKLIYTLGDDEFDYLISKNVLVFGNYGIFDGEQWAEIIPQEKTIVPMAKALKIIAKKMKVSPENIEIQS